VKVDRSCHRGPVPHPHSADPSGSDAALPRQSVMRGTELGAGGPGGNSAKAVTDSNREFVTFREGMSERRTWCDAAGPESGWCGPNGWKPSLIKQ
jgi:hypothetical protein